MSMINNIIPVSIALILTQQFHKIFSNASIIDNYEKSKYILLSADDRVARDQTENTKLAVFPILHTVKLRVVKPQHTTTGQK